ncbi:MAG: hypothetical protein HOG49_07755, partial [Candidatus Scalindua sp.]|nr:hypothetical protein [Candidatus Scalindua sp.]
MKQKLITICLAIFLITAISTNISNAADKTWTGGGADSDWSTGANWNSGEPGSGDNAIINNGGAVQITQSGEVAS